MTITHGLKAPLRCLLRAHIFALLQKIQYTVHCFTKRDTIAHSLTVFSTVFGNLLEFLGIPSAINYKNLESQGISRF